MKIELWEESIDIFLLDIDISKEQEKMTPQQINELLEVIQKQFLKMEKVANIDIYEDGEYSSGIKDVSIYLEKKSDVTLKKFKSYFYRYKSKLRKMGIVE